MKSELYAIDNKPSDETIIKMQHELMYLRQEVEFLKNYFSKEYRKVKAALMEKAAPIFEVIYKTM